MPPTLIDPPAHLDDARFRNDLPAVMQRAATAGVGHVVAVATGAASSVTCLDLAARFPGVSATVGIHPNHAAEAAAGDWDLILALAGQPGVVALGETGLD